MGMKNYRIRQRDLVPEKQIGGHSVAVVGVGAVGRPVAMQLACMGVRGLILVDPDRVEDVNVGTQMFPPQNIGRYKAAVTVDDCAKFMKIRPGKGCCTERFTERFEDVGWAEGERMDVVFCCVDTMASRGEIWRMVQDGRFGTKLWLDARVQGEVMRIFAVPLDNEEAREYYQGAWFPDDEAFEGRCTDRMTLYSAYVASGMMVGKYVTWMRREAKKGRLPLQVEIGLNIQTGDSTVYKEVW